MPAPLRISQTLIFFLKKYIIIKQKMKKLFLLFLILAGTNEVCFTQQGGCAWSCITIDDALFAHDGALRSSCIVLSNGGNGFNSCGIYDGCEFFFRTYLEIQFNDNTVKQLWLDLAPIGLTAMGGLIPDAEWSVPMSYLPSSSVLGIVKREMISSTSFSSRILIRRADGLAFTAGKMNIPITGWIPLHL